MSKDAVRETRAFFGDKAEAYRTSRSHGNPADLERMLAWLSPTPEWRALDVATGGGHTAVALAGRVRDVVATDVTPQMLAAVRRSAAERGLPNLAAAFADAQALPFCDGAFDAVTSRIAPHHFPDLPRFAEEAARVLRPGGALYVFDLTSPEDASAAEIVNRVETLRDPSHVWSYPPSAWEAALEAADLVVERLESGASEFDLEPWIARAELSASSEEELRRLLRENGPERLGGYGVVAPGRMRVLRVELIARKP